MANIISATADITIIVGDGCESVTANQVADAIKAKLECDDVIVTRLQYFEDVDH